MSEIKRVVGMFYPFDMYSQLILLDNDNNIIDTKKVKSAEFQKEILQILETNPNIKIELYGIHDLLEGLFKDYKNKYNITIKKGE